MNDILRLYAFNDRLCRPVKCLIAGGLNRSRNNVIARRNDGAQTLDLVGCFSHKIKRVIYIHEGSYRIQSHTRHKSAQVVAGYIREADKWTKSGLDGVGS